MDLPGHDGKVMSDINFIWSPYYRSKRADRDFLYEPFINSGLLWGKTWNNDYESEYESMSRISIGINSDPFKNCFWKCILAKSKYICSKEGSLEHKDFGILSRAYLEPIWIQFNPVDQ